VYKRQPVDDEEKPGLNLHTMRINGYHLAAWGIEELKDNVISKARVLSHVATAALCERALFQVWGNDAIVIRIK